MNDDEDVGPEGRDLSSSARLLLVMGDGCVWATDHRRKRKRGADVKYGNGRALFSIFSSKNTVIQ